MPNPFLNAALRYHALGYHPIPCQPRDKRPLVAWKEFQAVSPTTEQIQAWWAHTPDANVALVVGRGRFAVDLDGGGGGGTRLNSSWLTAGLPCRLRRRGVARVGDCMSF